MPTISAHPKVDMVTGELMLFDYKPFPPYLTYAVVSPKGELVHKTEIDLPGPRLQHDLAITERFTLFFDMSMQWDPELLEGGQDARHVSPGQTGAHRHSPAPCAGLFDPLVRDRALLHVPHHQCVGGGGSYRARRLQDRRARRGGSQKSRARGAHDRVLAARAEPLPLGARHRRRAASKKRAWTTC